ncbi:MAG: AAA family ATPase [Candidatus Marinimicrobia bacterium]|nr:AAA family ATPase [Candidatus Neomarinimicrobiota bacterium]
MTNTDLFSKLLEGPYSHFKKVGEDDWRDPDARNPGFSISSRGYFDHNSGSKGSLSNLCKEYNLIPAENRNLDTNKKELPQIIWDKSARADNPESHTFKLTEGYLTKCRSIPLINYSDILKKGLIRVNEYKGDKTLIYPSLNPEETSQALSGKPYSLKRIQRIYLNSDGTKHIKGKKHLGSNGEASAGFLIPAFNSSKFVDVVIMEGLEDALSLRPEYPECWFLVATDKSGLKNLTGFFNRGNPESCLIIADHDTDDKPEVTGQYLSCKLGKSIVDMGISVKVKMPLNPKEDANSALMLGKLKEWKESLIDVPEIFKADYNSQECGLRVIKASEVKIKPVKWLWPGVLAQGKLVIIAGDPGLGKSQISLFVCATVSNGGKWPVSGEVSEKGSSLILSAEDGVEDTIVPRLTAAGANLSKIFILQAVKLGKDKERSFDLTKDVDRLRKLSRDNDNVRLIVVDPISAYLGGTDSHKNADVRAALTPIIEFAEEIGACLLCVSHLNKTKQVSALSRVSGSIAFIASARASYIVARDPDDPNLRLMLSLKNNLAKETHGFRYQIEEKSLSEVTASYVSWKNDIVELSPEEVMNNQNSSYGNKDVAENFLLDALKGGDEIPVKDLQSEALELGFSKKVLWKAKEKLGIKSRKVSFDGRWNWYLPAENISEDYPKITQDSHII